MVLKRKRSESELSFSSASTFNSPPRPDQFTMMDMDACNTSPFHRTSRGSTPGHLHSRTMKRFRNSRPSDEEVHRKFYEWRAHQHHHRRKSQPNIFSRHSSAERTLNMLYTAQRQHIAHQHSQPDSLNATHTHPHPPTTTPSQGAQASLHSFWKLPTAAPPSAAALPSIDHDRAANCEDCGQTLREGAGDEDSMDVDGFGGEAQTGCGACGKHVCSHCSITNLGEQRRCLICAGKKVWIGGLGWAGVGVRAC